MGTEEGSSIYVGRRVLKRRKLVLRRKLKRRKIASPFQGHPFWPPAFENWTLAWVHKNFWRVKRYFNNDKQDAVQECALMYCKCCDHYGNIVTNHKWMMALYKKSVTTRWIYLSKRNTEYCSLFVDQEQLPEPIDNNTLGLLAAEIPDELQEALLTALQAPAEVIDWLLAGNLSSMAAVMSFWTKGADDLTQHLKDLAKP